MSRNLRFRPPPVVLTAALRWVLFRAYGPVGSDVDNGVDPREAVRVATSLGLSPRIAARQPRRVLERELDDHARATLRREHGRAVALELQRDRALHVLREIAHRIEVPLVLLKGMALRESAIVAAGSRLIGDVDVLVPDHRAWDLHHALTKNGFEPNPLPESEFHLPRVARSGLGAIEIHRILLGVRSHHRTSVTFSALEKGGHLEPVESVGRSIWRTTDAVLAAHVLVHGLVQHGNDPTEYSMAQMFSDLIDMGFGDANEPELVGEAHSWVRDEIRRTEILALDQLCRLLRQGAFEGRIALSSSIAEESILRHCLAARFDSRYVDSLRLRWLRPRLSDRNRFVQLIDVFRRSLFPTREQLEVRYGKPTHAVGYLGLRLTHPFATAARVLRSAMIHIGRRR